MKTLHGARNTHAIAAWLWVAAAMTLPAPAAAQTAAFGASVSTLDGVQGAMGGVYVDVDFSAWRALHVAGALSTAGAELSTAFFTAPLNRVYAGVGPRIRGGDGGDRVQVFAHILFGVVSVGAAGGIASAGYGEQYGGGVDWFLSDSWGLRTSLDYNRATHINIAATWRR